tara:strand:+ start:110 stop:493 length:384 start_codon:yes stop_codon:yes gene_type:complete
MPKKRASKNEIELRQSDAFKRLCEGEPSSFVVSAMAEKYSISRRQARRVVANAYDVVKQDLVEMDINRPEYLSRMIFMLEKGMFESLKTKNYAAMASCAKVLCRCIGLDTPVVNNHVTYHGRSRNGI